MMRPSPHGLLRLLIASVWIFHGLFSKLLDGIPRHREIVGRILGQEHARPVTVAVGVMEILLGLWVLSRILPRACAAVQTLAILSMNALEILRARDLLISAPGMLVLNAGFLALAWYSATRPHDHGSQPA
jgi:uncharacterized membrane protein YphA (DoxX/SURF4 family)